MFLDSIFVYSKKGLRGSIICTISAVCLMMVQIISISYDLAAPVECKGRSLILYIFSYSSQICLDIYQVYKIRILCRYHKSLRIVSLLTFSVRAISLLLNLCFYYDIVGVNLVCATGFPLVNLIAEKVILIFYNLINLGILYWITIANTPIASITQQFLFKVSFY